MTVKTQSASQLHHPPLSRWKWGRERTHPQSVMGIQRQGHLFHHCLCLVFTIHLLCQKKYTLPLFVLCFHPFVPVIWFSLSLLYFRSKKALQEVSSLPLSCDVLVFYCQISSPIFPLLLNQPFPQLRAHLFLSSYSSARLSPFSLLKATFLSWSLLPFWLRERRVVAKGVQSHRQKLGARVTGNTNYPTASAKGTSRRLNHSEWEDVLWSFGKVENNDHIEKVPLWTYKIYKIPGLIYTKGRRSQCHFTVLIKSELNSHLS